MKRKRLDATCVGVQDIEKTIKAFKEQYKGRSIRIELYEFSIIENSFSLVVWALD